MTQAPGKASASRPIWARMLRNTGWLLSARALNAPLGLLESVLLARFLGVAGYGTLGLVMATVIAVQRLLSFRMSEFSVRYVSEALERRDRPEASASLKLAMVAEVGSAAGAFLVAIFAAPLLAGYFVPGTDSVGMIRLFALFALANAGIESSTGALQVFDRFRFIAATNVLRKCLLVALLGASLVFEGGLGGSLTAYVVASLLANIAVVVTTFRTASLKLGKRWWTTPTARVRARWREMGHFAITTNLGATLSLVIKDSDLLWIGFFRSPEEAGYYKLATTLLKVPFAAGTPMAKAFYPEIARLVPRAPLRQVRQFLVHNSLAATAWVAPLAGLTALLAPWIIEFFYGSTFGPAVPALWILLVGTALAHVFFWTRPTLLALGRPEIPLKIALLNAILKLGLGLAFVPAWGYLGLSAILSVLNLNGLTLASLAIKRQLKDPQIEPET